MSKRPQLLMVVFFIFYFFTLLINDGFMGTDEYWTGITRYVPAQTQNPSNILKSDDVKSPSQILPLLATSKVALAFGIESPYAQYRFVQIFWALACTILFLFCLFYYLNPQDFVWALVVFTFYCAAPFAFTRPMYESLSAPFVLTSALALRKHMETFKTRDLIISVVAITLAYCFRPQTGIAALGLLGFSWVYSSKKQFIYASVLGLVCFASLGFVDLWILGEWHKSLKDILIYNVKFGATYSVQPWYFYITLSLAILMIPFFISRHFLEIIKQNFFSQKVFWVYIILILGLHSFFPQKWERFALPVLPLFLLILSDWIKDFWQKGSTIRISILAAFHILLLVPASFFPAQKNLIEMSLHLNDQPNILNLYRLNKSPEWITEVFILRKDYQWIEISGLPEVLQCSDRVIMNEKDFEAMPPSNFVVDQIFQTNLIEKLTYHMNPTKNIRRTPLYLLKSKNC